ncbi:hypothetical protein Rhal01_02581 [Rubritalea halochordaticola]|uniref:Uncharacterized protein n=1 Tax=Rubritalea halochordaticola TaxID=714537 RepID=A0ABP9V129_9BACT
MSWNLYIGSDTENSPLGEATAIQKAFNEVFDSLEWEQLIPSDECSLNVHGGFSIEFTKAGDHYESAMTRGGYNHLKELAMICKQFGWQLFDCQEGEQLDLENPYSLYE